jgi:hypothetical protein
MEDTTPLEIVSGTGPTAADPVRSLWQTASVGVRMIMDVSFKMRRSGMIPGSTARPGEELLAVTCLVLRNANGVTVSAVTPF